MSTVPSATETLPPNVTVDDDGNACLELAATQPRRPLPYDPKQPRVLPPDRALATLKIIAGADFPGFALIDLRIEGRPGIGLHLGPAGIRDFYDGLGQAVNRCVGGGPALHEEIAILNADDPAAALHIRTVDRNDPKIVIELVAGRLNGHDQGGRVRIEVPFQHIQTAFLPHLETYICPRVDATRQATVEISGTRGDQSAISRPRLTRRQRLHLVVSPDIHRFCLITISPDRQRDFVLRLTRAGLAKLETALAAAADHHASDGDGPGVDVPIGATDLRGRSADVKVRTTPRAVTISLVGNPDDDDRSNVAATDIPYSDVAKILVPAIRDELRPRMRELCTA